MTSSSDIVPAVSGLLNEYALRAILILTPWRRLRSPAAGSAERAAIPIDRVRNPRRCMVSFMVAPVYIHAQRRQESKFILDADHWLWPLERQAKPPAHLAGSIVWRSRWGRRFRLPVIPKRVMPPLELGQQSGP